MHRSSLVCVLTALTLLTSIPGVALVSTGITLDGTFTDWTPVFDDAANCQYDTTGDAGNTNADITLAASTADGTYLYQYYRRAAATGGAAPTFFVFIDLDGDRRLEVGDRVLQYRLVGGNTYSSAALFAYTPADAANGDPMGGAIAGAWPTEITFGSAPYAGYGENGGAQFEGRIAWSALGVPATTPVTLQFAASQGSTVDYTGVVSLERYGVTLEPDGAKGGTAGAAVVYPHVLKNTGNTQSRFELTVSSSRGWAVLVRRQDDQRQVTHVDLAPGQQLTVEVVLQVPDSAASGIRDTVTVRAQHSTAGVSDSATDITTVGPLIIVPDSSGSILPGGTIVYRNTVHNNTADDHTVALTATSDHGWDTDIYDSAGVTPISEIFLAAGQSTTVTVRVAVPVGTDIGTVDVATVEGRCVAAPSVKGRGYDTTTVRPELEVAPDNAYPAGAGTSVLYRHTVTNSSAAERTLSLTATSARGWPAVVLAADGATPLPTITLSAFGGSAEVVVRVTVPAGTPTPTTDVTTLRAALGPLADTATDTTTVSRLATFGISGFGTPQNTFDLGDRVYARGMGLPPASTVTFQWNDPLGRLVATSTARVDATGIAQGSIDVGADLANVGTWTVTLLNGTTLIDSKPFYIGYRASLSAPTISGGDTLNSPVTVSTTMTNHGAAPLPGTSVTYCIWWDANSDGALGAGDSYVAEDGTWTAVGSGSGRTFVRSPIDVGVPSGSYTDTWSISNEDFRQSGTYRLTTAWTSDTGTVIDERTTQFFAVPGRAALSLTLSKTLIDFGAVDPGATYSDSGVQIGVAASSDYALQAAFGGQSSALGLSNTLSAQTLGAPTVGTSYTDVLRVTIPWNTDPGAYTATITYTIVAR